MIRVTKEQFALFKKRVGKKTGKSAVPRQRKRRDELPENQLEKAILDFLRYRNWTITRNHVGRYVGIGPLTAIIKSGRRLTWAAIGSSVVQMGEVGQADYTASRPMPVTQLMPLSRASGACQRFHFECKAPGKEPSAEQLEWLRRARANGEVADWFDGLDTGRQFLSWYRERWGL